MSENKELMKIINEELKYLKDIINKYAWKSIEELPKMGKVDGSYLCRIEDDKGYYEYKVLVYKISGKRFYNEHFAYTKENGFKEVNGSRQKLTNWKRIEPAKRK